MRPEPSTFFGLRASSAFFNAVHLVLVILPATFTTPSSTVAVMPGISLIASFTACVSGSSWVITTGAGGGGGTELLFTVDLTPFIAFTAGS